MLMQVKILCSRCGSEDTTDAIGTTGEAIITAARDHFVRCGWRSDSAGDRCPYCARLPERSAGSDAPLVTINWASDERVEILVNGQVVAEANHDEHGWDGMDAATRTATAVAKAAGLRVETAGVPNL